MSVEPPSGRQHTLVHGDARAVVVEVGGGIRSYEVAGREVLAGYGEGEMAGGARGQVLVPWPNRLRDGRYTWDGTEHQLPLSEPEKRNAIHGLVRWASWTTGRQSTSEVELRHVLRPQEGYPFALELTVAYRLDDDGLSVTTTATNAGDRRLPYAAGQHPYLATSGRVDDCSVQLDAAEHVQTDERGLPTGRHPVAGTPYDFREQRPVGSTELDLAFTDLARDEQGRAQVVLTSPDGGRTRLWVDGSYRYVELFTGDSLPDAAQRRRSLGVEPMTAPPDAFGEGVDLIALEPGERTRSTWGVQVTLPEPAT